MTAPQNTQAAARVSPAQIRAWQKAQLPSGVPRRALTYSAVPSAEFHYQLQPGRYYPYPQTYYRQHGIGYDLLQYALVMNAVSHLSAPVVVVPPGAPVAPAPVTTSSQGDLAGVTYTQTQVTQQSRGIGWLAYLLVGLISAVAGWFVLGRKRRVRPQ